MQCARVPKQVIIWFKHILFRRKGLGVAYKATMPSADEVFTKEHNFTHTHTHMYTHTSKNRMFDNIKRDIVTNVTGVTK